MTKEKRLQIRLSDEDYAKLEAYAQQKDVSMAQVLRDYIKRLPKPVTYSKLRTNKPHIL
ncbi:MAG: ribbon-helix-helix protein, CopG family [Microcystaceae cyanobacterium]